MQLFIQKYLFYVLAFISIALVWFFPYYVTGDGACHLYNATILNDYLHHRNTVFYNQFYKASEHISPNWFTHYFLVVCMQVFSPLASEKILISLCIVTVLYGFKYLLKQLGNTQLLGLFLFIPFVFQTAFFKGFYNYMLSLGFYFFLLGYFVKHKNKIHFKHLLTLSLGMLGLYIVHIIGLLLLYITMGITALATIFLTPKNERSYKLLLQILCISIPSFLLCIYFAIQFKTPLLHETIPYIAYAKNLFTLNSLHTHVNAEKYLALLFALFIFVVTVFYIFKTKTILKNNRWFIIFGCQTFLLLLIYFFIPENMFGGGVLHTRIEALVYIFIILAISNLFFEQLWTTIFSVIAIVFCIIFIGIKIPTYSKGNSMLTSLMEIEPYIDNQSVILPLSFEHSGIWQGKSITDNTLFYGTHCAEYLGSKKQLIFTDNYEAISGLFPLTWQEGKDPFKQLTNNNKLEDERPEITLSNYTLKVDTIDYILLFNLTAAAKNTDSYKKIMDSASAHYTMVHLNADSSIILLKHQ